MGSHIRRSSSGDRYISYPRLTHFFPDIASLKTAVNKFCVITYVQAFSEFGSISDANVVFDRETGRSKGFGFVTFGDRASAEKALAAMNQAV